MFSALIGAVVLLQVMVARLVFLGYWAASTLQEWLFLPQHVARFGLPAALRVC